MSHPMRGAANESSRAKMKALTGHAKTGRPHLNEGERTKAFAHSFRHKHEHSVSGHSGHKRLDRYARGGRTKKPHVKINIVNNHTAPGMPPMTGGPMGPMGGSPPGVVPPPAVAGLGAPGMPPGVRARGGRAYAKGGIVRGDKGIVRGEGKLTGPDKSSLTEAEQKKFLMRAKGGKVGKFIKMKAGAGSGEGRLELSKKQKKTYK